MKRKQSSRVRSRVLCFGVKYRLIQAAAAESNLSSPSSGSAVKNWTAINVIAASLFVHHFGQRISGRPPSHWSRSPQHSVGMELTKVNLAGKNIGMRLVGQCGCFIGALLQGDGQGFRERRQGPEPVYIRYAWANPPEVDLYNSRLRPSPRKNGRRWATSRIDRSKTPTRESCMPQKQRYQHHETAGWAGS